MKVQTLQFHNKIKYSKHYLTIVTILYKKSIVIWHNVNGCKSKTHYICSYRLLACDFTVLFSELTQCSSLSFTIGLLNTVFLSAHS